MDLRGVFDDLVRFETILWNAIDARLQRECGVSLGSLNAMLVIASTPSCRVQDIAHAVAITVGGASQAVDRLEAAGHCVRRPNPVDRRSSLLQLTAAGQELLKRAGAVFDQELETFLRVPLSQRSLGQLAAALATLRGAATPTNTSDENSQGGKRS
ncbi:MAG: MarR family winged helix-turn-helix transcriptional regulator [Solirubrobacteraceae bacterium]